MRTVYLTLAGILLLSGFFTTTLSAQRNCGAMEHLEMQMQQDPKRALKLEQIEQQTRRFIQQAENRAVNGVITIPVVVHIIYNNATENISNAQIQSQMDVLNADFRRTNSDANNTWSQAADTEIEFCMATVDPNGSPTNGITRTSTSVSSFSTNDNMKFDSQGGKDAWPAGDYLNMWVCDISGSILGYAQFPGGDPATDGVVMDYQYFGTIGTATAPFDGGRTTTHEVGHWLNLRHIWGDGNCSADDFVGDTPTSDAPNYGCASGHVSCGSTDMVQNYMDYSDDACMNLYTQGQKTRMRALFDTGGARESLLNASACGAAPTPTCDDGIQNGDETGVDCGGSSCPACPPQTCTDVAITINFDNYPEETSWQIANAGGQVVASGGTYGSQPDGSTLTITECLDDGCYDFTINDSYGDGICCSYGNGSYSVSVDGSVVVSGASFGSSETTNFCISGGPTPTCDDGVQNGDETGVDCGGSNCPACPTCDDGIQNGSETGVDCGGPDCAACPTCDDGIQNGGETGVDCGGPDCAACPTCDDGIQNGNETGIDCGGPDCAACPSCDDGVQNGDETGVDCGGSCPACPPPPSCTDVVITINLDNYPEETSWQITNAGGQVVASGGTYGSQPDGSTVTITECLDDGCYDFTINDSYGDGICCSYGNGSYTVSVDGSTVASGGNFGSSETTNFCVGGGPAPTCDDGIQNGNETGVDCGGPDCAPCCTDVTVSITLDNYPAETSWTITNASGATVASGGTYGGQANGSTVNITECLDAGCYDFTINDSYGDGICCAYGNGSYTVSAGGGTVASGGSFGSSETTNFCVGSGARFANTDASTAEISAPSLAQLQLFPNPAQDLLNIDYTFSGDVDGQVQAYVMDITGKMLWQTQWNAVAGKQRQTLDVSAFAAGMYTLHLTNGKETISQKFAVTK